MREAFGKGGGVFIIKDGIENGVPMMIRSCMYSSLDIFTLILYSSLPFFTRRGSFSTVTSPS